MGMYHPIGTIVKLTIDENALFMIAGYLVRQNKGKINDYLVVPYPFGLTNKKQYICCDRECITEVVHTGYCDEEGQKVLKGFDQIVENLKKEMEVGD